MTGQGYVLVRRQATRTGHQRAVVTVHRRIERRNKEDVIELRDFQRVDLQMRVDDTYCDHASGEQRRLLLFHGSREFHVMNLLGMDIFSGALDMGHSRNFRINTRHGRQLED